MTDFIKDLADLLLKLAGVGAFLMNTGLTGSCQSNQSHNLRIDILDGEYESSFVTVDAWNDEGYTLQLSGQYNGTEDFLGYIKFRNPGRNLIEAPFQSEPQCRNGYVEKECWPTVHLVAKQPTELLVSRPTIRPERLPDGENQLTLTWEILEEDEKNRLGRPQVLKVTIIKKP